MGSYLPGIDALRALAVITVMVFHMNPRWMPGGYSGVDVFFVISGYVISRSMMTFDTRAVRGFVAEFYARRVQRILPALLVCLLITAVLDALFVPNSWLSAGNTWTLRYAVLGLGNVTLMTPEDAYFAPRADFNPYLHTWSLGVEEQFYLLYPLVFFIWLAAVPGSRRRTAGRALLWASAAASLAYCAIATDPAPITAYYSLPSRWWELAAGGLLFQWHAAGRRIARPGRTGRTLQLLASLVLIGVALAVPAEAGFPFPWAMASVAGAMAVIDAVVAVEAAGARMSWLGSTGLVWIGQRSYSLYLYHWPVYVLLRWTTGLETTGQRLLALALTFSLAALSYAWIETPFRHVARRRQLSRTVVLAGGLAAVGLASVAVYGIVRERAQVALSVTQRHHTSWYPDAWSGTPAGDRASCRLSVSATTLPGGGGRERFEAAGCGSTGDEVRLFVAGNSHALTYRTMLTRLALERPVVVYTYWRSNCTFASLAKPMRGASPDCAAFFDDVLRDVQLHRRAGDVLFLPALRLPRLSDQWGPLSDSAAVEALVAPQATRSRSEARRETAGILGRLTADGMTVVLEAPKPVFRAPAFRCSDWFNRNNPICAGGLRVPRDFMLRYRAPVVDVMNDLAGRVPRVLVWDPFDALCPGPECHAVPNGVPLFFDGDHLSGAGNEVLYPEFQALIDSLIERGGGA